MLVTLGALSLLLKALFCDGFHRGLYVICDFLKRLSTNFLPKTIKPLDVVAHIRSNEIHQSINQSIIYLSQNTKSKH